MRDLSIIEKILGYTFSDKNLLKVALTHSSYANEHNIKDYERLEFLGDSIITLAISKFLMIKYKNLSEGRLSKIKSFLVSEEVLSNIIEKNSLGQYIIVSEAITSSPGGIVPSILADVFESLIGAVYCDSDSFDRSYEVIVKLMADELKKDYTNSYLNDYKSHILELASSEKVQLKFHTFETDSFQLKFCSELIKDGKIMSKGYGVTKKKAEQDAAFKALNSYKKKN